MQSEREQCDKFKLNTYVSSVCSNSLVIGQNLSFTATWLFCSFCQLDMLRCQIPNSCGVCPGSTLHSTQLLDSYWMLLMPTSYMFQVCLKVNQIFSIKGHNNCVSHYVFYLHRLLLSSLRSKSTETHTGYKNAWLLFYFYKLSTITGIDLVFSNLLIRAKEW